MEISVAYGSTLMSCINWPVERRAPKTCQPSLKSIFRHICAIHISSSFEKKIQNSLPSRVMKGPIILCTTLLFASTNAIPRRPHHQRSGCRIPLPSDIEPGKSINQTIDIQSGASPRKYRIHLPEDYRNEEPVPLILSFHGRSRDMKYQEELSQFSNASYGFKGIAVYPEGIPV